MDQTTCEQGCPYNEGVNCGPHQKRCETCGWNPEVAAVRIKKLYKEHEKGQAEKKDVNFSA